MKEAEAKYMFTRRQLTKLIIPLIIEQVLIVTMGMVDTIMVSGVGEAAVSGVSLVDSINVLLIGLFSALATGGAVISSQLLGQDDKKSARKSGEQLLIASFSLSMVLMVVTLLLRGSILQLVYGDVDEAVMGYAKTYFFYSALSFPFLAIYNSCAALFRSMGNSKISMRTSLVSNVINIVFNYILIVTLDMGVAGAAIATLMSRVYAAVVLYIKIKNKGNVIYLEKLKDFRINLSIMKKILRIGIPNGVENSLFQLGKIIVQGIIAGLGTSAITANAVASNIGSFGNLPGSAIGLALITVVGQCMGSKDYDGVKQYTRKLIKVTYLTMIGLNVVLFLFIPVILKIYRLSDETAAIASGLMMYHCILSCVIWPLSFTLPNALRAASDAKYTMWTSMISMWVWRIAFSYVLGIYFELGVLGVWIAMTIDWLFRAICFTVRFKKEGYRRVSI